MNFSFFLISYFKQRYTAGLWQSSFSAFDNRQKCLLTLEAIKSGNLEVVVSLAILLEPLSDSFKHSGADTLL